MSEWNNAIETAAQYCEKLEREAGTDRDIDRHVAVTMKRAFAIASASIRELKKPEGLPQKPAVGRIVHVMIRREGFSGLFLRPAIITSVEVAQGGRSDLKDLVSLQVFLTPEEVADGVHARALDAFPSPEGGEWKENTWRWPERS